jgi:hypothetical protein
MTIARVLMIAALLAPATAYADDDDHDGSRPRKTWPFGAVSLVLGEPELGSVVTSFSGFGFAAGYRHRSYALYGQAMVGYQRDSDTELSSLFTELTVHARGTIKRVDFGSEVGLATWVDGGIGVQRMDWSRGALTRPVVSISVGLSFDLSTRKATSGVTYELRITGAPSVAWDATSARCTDGCALRTDRYDFGTIFLVTVPFSLGSTRTR